MLGIGKEVAAVAQQPSYERVRGLKRIVSCSTIKSILKRTGQDRQCPRLPKRFMVWFVIGMGLFSTDCYRQVFRWLQSGRSLCRTPPRSSLCEARLRLGVAPFFALLDAIVGLLALPATAGAFYRGMRLMAVDGFVLDIPDTVDNDRVFGRPQSGRSRSAFPQVRLLALCEVGTHVIWKVLLKPIRRAEIAMAKTLLRYLKPDMLLMWDRGFLSYDNVRDVLAGQANLLARIKKSLKFEDREPLADGSYRSTMYRSATDRRHERNGVRVRVIEYRIEDPGRPGAGEKHRLLTTLFDPQLDPALRLIELYHERWEIELTIDEMKTDLRERPVLRSQTPAGVVQEVYGLLLAHYVVRQMMFEAATRNGMPPRRISFTGALSILCCRMPEAPRDERGLKHWYERLLNEIAEEILPERRDRVNPRVIKKKMSKWNKKRPKHRETPQPTMPFQKSIRIIC